MVVHVDFIRRQWTCPKNLVALSTCPQQLSYDLLLIILLTIYFLEVCFKVAPAAVQSNLEKLELQLHSENEARRKRSIPSSIRSVYVQVVIILNLMSDRQSFWIIDVCHFEIPLASLCAKNVGKVSEHRNKVHDVLTKGRGGSGYPRQKQKFSD